MTERKFWLALAALFAVGGIIQLPWAPSRFGAAFFLTLAVGCAGMWLVLRLRDQHRACRVLAVVGRILFALFVVSFALIQIFVIQAGMRTDDADTHADYYLVLGALVNPDGQPSAALAARCDTAAALLAANPDSKAVLCGGQGGNEPCTEADSMYAYLTEQKGVDPARLLREDQSTNTIQNLTNARVLIETTEGRAHGDYTAAVVTSDYHLARAKMLLQRAGYEEGLGVPAPTPYPGQWVAVRCREYCSILGLMLTGRWTV